MVCFLMGLCSNKYTIKGCDSLLNELIAVNYDSEQPTVLGRDLHEALEIKTEYKKWFDRMSEYGFEDGKDYVKVTQKCLTSSTGQNITNHQLTLPMAKEICMLQRSDKGKQYRQYFLKLEEKWNSPESILARALQIANSQLEEVKSVNQQLSATVSQQEQQISELKPKGEYYDIVLSTPGLMNVTEIAKDYGISAKVFNVLLNQLGIIFKQHNTWVLYQAYVCDGLAKSNTYVYTDYYQRPNTSQVLQWTQKGRLFLYNRLKQEGILPIVETGFLNQNDHNDLVLRCKRLLNNPSRYKRIPQEVMGKACKEYRQGKSTMKSITKQLGICPQTFRNKMAKFEANPNMFEY